MSADKDARIAELENILDAVITETANVLGCEADNEQILVTIRGLQLQVSPELIDSYQAQHEHIVELERRLAEQQVIINSAEIISETCFYDCENGYFQIYACDLEKLQNTLSSEDKELNNLIAKAKEEGRKEVLSAVTEYSMLIRNDSGDVGSIYLNDFRLAVQTDVMREVRNRFSSMLNELSASQLTKAKESASPKP